MILRRMNYGRDHVETALTVALVAVAVLQAALLVVGLRAFAALF